MPVTVRRSLSTESGGTLRTRQNYTSRSLLYQPMAARLQLHTQGPSELLFGLSPRPRAQPGRRGAFPCRRCRRALPSRSAGAAGAGSATAPQAPPPLRRHRPPRAARTCYRCAARSRARPAAPRAARLTHAGARDVQGAEPAQR